jgi:hypothetical protein
VFTTILTRYPDLADHVPRLFPIDENQQPAQFLTTHLVDLGGGSYGARGPFALHYWQPADYQGVVAIAYPSSYLNSIHPEKATAALLARVDVSALVVSCAMADPLPNGEIGDRQPVVGVDDARVGVVRVKHRPLGAGVLIAGQQGV